MTISHVWPGITPFNIFNLELRMWLAYSAACDAWVAAQRKRGEVR